MDARSQASELLIFRQDWSGITGLANAISEIDPDDLSREYEVLRHHAPRRHDVDKRYFVGHDGRLSPIKETGESHCHVDERHLEIALWRVGGFWPREDAGRLRLLDYQFPLRSQNSDKDRAVDLLGVTDRGRLIVIELKVKPKSDMNRGESPMAALIQGLRYAAIVDTNRAAIAEEVKCRFGEDIAEEPPIVQILAPKSWWRGWLEISGSTRGAAGAWEPEFVRLTRDIEERLGVGVEFMALDDVQHSDIDFGSDRRHPQVNRTLAVHLFAPATRRPSVRRCVSYRLEAK